MWYLHKDPVIAADGDADAAAGSCASGFLCSVCNALFAQPVDSSVNIPVTLS